MLKCVFGLLNVWIRILHSTKRGAPDAVNDVIFHARSALLHDFVWKIWLDLLIRMFRLLP